MAHQSPLLEQHTHAEASTLPYGPPAAPIEVVETFGEVDFEYAAIRKACGLFDLPHRAIIEVRGADRVPFLNNMLTQQIKDIAPFQTRQTFWLSRKGRIVADIRLVELGDRMLFDVDAHAAAETVRTLNEYVIADDVAFEDVTEAHHRIALHGPTAPLLLAAAVTQPGPGPNGPPPAELTPGAACVAQIAGTSVIIERHDFTGAFGVDITAAKDGIAAVYRELVALGRPEENNAGDGLQSRVKLRETGWLAVNMARIEAGNPMLFVDFTTESLPAECGETVLNDRVSFTKGCYLGQEVVARMHSLGKPKQTIVGLRPAGEPPRDAQGHAMQPIGGAQVFPEGDTVDPVGVVTSSTISPMLGGVPVAFATVRTKHAIDGETVMVAAEGTTMPMQVQRGTRFYSPGT